MGSRELIFYFALTLILQGCCVFSQFSFQVPKSIGCVATAPATGQFVIPAIIKPILQPDICQNFAPSVPNFGGCGSFPAPFVGMPPIIIDDDNDDKSMIYWLILALTRRRNQGYCGGCGCGGGCGGGCGCGCGCGCGGGCGNGCGSGCGSGSGSGSTYNGGNGCCGGYGGGFNGNCGCGTGCNYIPYPVLFPCCSSLGGSCSLECKPAAEECGSTNKVNIIVSACEPHPHPPPKKEII